MFTPTLPEEVEKNYRCIAHFVGNTPIKNSPVLRRGVVLIIAKEKP
jgi:hypothetical protein